MLGPAEAGLSVTATLPAMPKILVVADTAWVRNDVHSALSEPGWELIDHDDPPTVPRVAHQNDVDAAVVDFQVKTMGGMAITRALKEAHQVDGIDPVPVVLLLDRSADAFLAKRAGAEGWVKKPFTAATLREALEVAMGAETTTR